LEPEIGIQRLPGNYVSQTDRAKGFAAEATFIENIKKLGLEIYKLPHYSHNYKKRVDFEIVDPKTGRATWVDVKAPRALRKAMGPKDTYGKPQDRYVCLEVSKNGSLFSGESDYIVFQQTDGTFLWASKVLLVDFLNKKLVNSTERSTWPETACCVPYVRSYMQMHMVLTYVDLTDLQDCITFVT
jgi:hypothetical protein